MRQREFTCSYCLRRCVSDWTQEKAEAEYAAQFPAEAAAGGERGVVCDDCYRFLTAGRTGETFLA